MAKALNESKAEVEQSEFDKIFVEWDFNDKAGNRITVRPWSLTKSKKTCKIIGEIYQDMVEQYNTTDINTIFREYPHTFFTTYLDKLCEVIYITVDRDEKWLDNIDIAIGLEVLDVIWKQNFSGARVSVQMEKWVVRSVGGLPSEIGSNPPLEQVLPGNM